MEDYLPNRPEDAPSAASVAAELVRMKSQGAEGMKELKELKKSLSSTRAVKNHSALLDWGVGGARTAVRPKLSTSCSAWACESGAEPQRAPRASCPAALRA